MDDAEVSENHSRTPVHATKLPPLQSVGSAQSGGAPAPAAAAAADAAAAAAASPIYIDGLLVSAPNAARLARSKYYVTDGLEPDLALYRRCLNEEASWTVSSARPGNDVEDLLSDNVSRAILTAGVSVNTHWPVHALGSSKRFGNLMEQPHIGSQFSSIRCAASSWGAARASG